jgi:hypothetical protein
MSVRTEVRTLEVAAPRARWPLSPRRTMALALLLIQLAWVFAVPPFGGSDEFDHVYRAASVARGQWGVDPSAATRGTGALLEVPDDIVAAAHPQCESLPYTGPEDCVGTKNGDGTTTIASGAGRYHPLFYAFVGIPALPFDGYAAVYVMRLATVLLGWLLFCGAIAATRSWARTPWPYVGLALAATPVVTYSASVVAPNGVEIFAALMCWTSLIGLFRSAAAVPDRRLLLYTAISGSVLATTRGLGPLWLLLVLVTAAVAAPLGLDRVRALLRDRVARLMALVVGLATLQSTWWILTVGSLNVGGEAAHPSSLGTRIGLVSSESVLWVFQSVAAFPLRDQASPTIVYACYLLLFFTFLVLALRASSGSVRRGLALATAAAIVVPFVISVATYDAHAAVWQGRYGLPFAVGLAVLGGLAFDTSPTPRRFLQLRTQALAVAMFVIAYTVGLLGSARRSSGHDPLRDSASWVHPPLLVVGVLAALASGALWWSATKVEAER